MALLKQIDALATSAWSACSSEPYLFACGSVCENGDDSFQTNSALLLYRVELAKRAPNARLVGQAKVSDSTFDRVAWGSKGVKEGTHPLGMVAGGMADGSIYLWNAHDVLNSKSKEFTALRKHQASISGLEFHPSESNLLASGSMNSEILVWDLRDLANPGAKRPGVQGANSGIADLAWNVKVPNILAVSKESGETSVWDLRSNRAVITIAESTHMHIPATSVAWNPQQARQLAVAYSSPVAELWDVRFAKSPRAKLEGGHSASILSVAWCPHDSNIIMTGGEDSTTCIWNSDGQFLNIVRTRCIDYYLQDSSASYFMRWNPHIPGIYTTSSYDSKISVRSVYAGTQTPSWCGRRVGASFGFGSKLVSFGTSAGRGQVTIARLITEPGLVRQATEFQSKLQYVEPYVFCGEKIEGSGDIVDEREAWEMIRFLFESNSLERVLTYLGHPPVASPKSTDVEGPSLSPLQVDPFENDEVSDADFFDRLSGESDANDRSSDTVGCKAAEVAPVISTKKTVRDAPYDEIDLAVNNSLLVGDFKGASEKCIGAGRHADAMVLAHLGGPEVWSAIQKSYCDTHSKRYMRTLVSCISKSDFGSFIVTSSSNEWKDTLALLLTFATGDALHTGIRQLAAHLQHHGLFNQAVICCIASGNVDETVAALQRIPKQSENESPLHGIVEKIYIMQQALKQQHLTHLSSLASSVFGAYAGLLAAQGELATALEFLSFTSGGVSDPGIDELSRRLATANSDSFPQSGQGRGESGSRDSVGPRGRPIHHNHVSPSPVGNRTRQRPTDFTSRPHSQPPVSHQAVQGQQPPPVGHPRASTRGAWPSRVPGRSGASLARSAGPSMYGASGTVPPPMGQPGAVPSTTPASWSGPNTPRMLPSPRSMVGGPAVQRPTGAPMVGRRTMPLGPEGPPQRTRIPHPNAALGRTMSPPQRQMPAQPTQATMQQPILPSRAAVPQRGPPQRANTRTMPGPSLGPTPQQPLRGPQPQRGPPRPAMRGPTPPQQMQPAVGAPMMPIPSSQGPPTQQQLRGLPPQGLPSTAPQPLRGPSPIPHARPSYSGGPSLTAQPIRRGPQPPQQPPPSSQPSAVTPPASIGGIPGGTRPPRRGPADPQGTPRIAAGPPSRPGVPNRPPSQQQQPFSSRQPQQYQSSAPLREPQIASHPSPAFRGLEAVNPVNASFQTAYAEAMASASEVDRTKLERCQQGLHALYGQVDSNALSAETFQKVQTIAQGFAHRDYQTVSRVHLDLIQTSWNESKAWLNAVRDLNTVCKQFRP